MAKGKRNVLGSMALKIAVLALVVYGIFSLTKLQINISEKQKLLNEQLKPQAEELHAAVDELKVLVENGTDEDLIERAAREKLGYVYSDEQVFTDVTN